jgi:hypothetical protein
VDELVEQPAEAEPAQNPTDQLRQKAIAIADRTRALIGVLLLPASRKFVQPSVEALERLFARVVRLGHCASDTV